MRMLNTFFREIMTQSKTALRAGTLLIILRGRSTRSSFIDFNCAPVGVPLRFCYSCQIKSSDVVESENNDELFNYRQASLSCKINSKIIFSTAGALVVITV